MVQKLIHKSKFYNNYSDLISENQSEKVINSTMLSSFPKGSFLDIGGGSDSASIFLANMQPNQTLTVLDIEPTAFKTMVTKHPETKRFLYKGQEKLLKLRWGDATKLPFNDSQYNIINASSLVHEIFTYSGGVEGVKMFFAEAARTIKVGGILSYRDPTLEENYERAVQLVPKTELSTAFFNFFCANTDINKSKINAQEAREVTRHYITFLKEVIPYAWISNDTKTGAFPKSAFPTFLQDANLTDNIQLLTLEQNIGDLRAKYIQLVVEVLQGKDREENGLKRLFLRIKERFDFWCEKELKEKYTYMTAKELNEIAKSTFVDKKIGKYTKKYYFEPQLEEYFERIIYSDFLNLDFDLFEENGSQTKLNDSKTSIKYQLVSLNNDY